jgi:hypothetical protein
LAHLHAKAWCWLLTSVLASTQIWREMSVTDDRISHHARQQSGGVNSVANLSHGSADDLADLRPADGDESPAGHSFDEAAKSKGWAGTANLASLLIAMQAREFVLSTGSNWSRLMNELRKAVLDDRCDGCTRMIDLQPGEW